MAFSVRHLVISAGVSTVVLLAATACQAQAAEPATPCAGPSPVAGVDIRGPVLHVIDGETLCVALGFESDSWIKLRLADAAPARVKKTSTAREGEGDPRGALMQVALAKMADCRTRKNDNGKIVADCTIDGRPIGQQLRDPGVVAASYSWR